MAKLTDVRIHACHGDDCLGLQYNGERTYFPHVHVGEPDTCTNPRYYRSSTGHLEQIRGHYLTINEVGAHNHNGQIPFDAMAQLFAAAPEMLRLLDRLTDDDHMNGNDKQHRQARRLADALLALDIPDASEAGWGPYYNQDGTPWKDITNGK